MRPCGELWASRSRKGSRLTQKRRLVESNERLSSVALTALTVTSKMTTAGSISLSGPSESEFSGVSAASRAEKGTGGDSCRAKPLRRLR